MADAYTAAVTVAAMADEMATCTPNEVSSSHSNGLSVAVDGDAATLTATMTTTTTTTAAAAAASTPGAPFWLLSKLKTAVHDVVTHLDNAANTHDIDACIAVTEDCLKALRTLKVQHRIEARRQHAPSRLSNVSPRGNKNITGGAAAAASTNAAAAPTLASAPPTAACAGVGATTGTRVGMPVYTEVAVHDVVSRAHTPPPTTAHTAATATLAPPPRTYAAVVSMRTKKVSPKRVASHGDSVPSVAASVTRDDVESARHTSALRSEERQRQAEERRLDFRQEMRQKLEAADARSLRAKTRREEAERRQRLEALDRMESTRRRAEEARRQTVERVHRAHSHVEEVRLTNELRRQTKALLLDKKMSDVEQNQEHLREERQRVMQERQEAMLAAAERRRNLSEERLQRQAQREQQRQEHLRRVEEQRRCEMQLKQQRAEEWEKKVQQHHADAHAENEALQRRTEEKLHVSAQLREEQRERLLRKLEKEEQRQREARLRRERELGKSVAASSPSSPPSSPSPPPPPSPPSLTPTTTTTTTTPATTTTTMMTTSAVTAAHEVLHPIVVNDDEQGSQRLAKAAAAMARQLRTFVDQYQKESSYAVKDLNRSRLRPPFSRLTTALVLIEAACTTPTTGATLGSTTATTATATAAAAATLTTMANAGTTATTTMTAAAVRTGGGGGASVLSVLLQCKQPLSELLTAELGDLDHEYVRYFGGFDVLLRVFAAARRARCGEVLLRAADALHKLLTDEQHGRDHAVYFARSGGVAQLVLAARDEARLYRRGTSTDAVRGVLLLLNVVLERTVCDAPSSARLLAVRDHVMADLDATSVERLCAGVLCMSPREDELAMVYSAATVLHVWVGTLTRRKGGGIGVPCLRLVSAALFTLLLELIVGSAQLRPLADDAPSGARVTVLFAVLRTLNMLARTHLAVFQQLLLDSPSTAATTRAPTAAAATLAAAPALPPPSTSTSGTIGKVATATATTTATIVATAATTTTTSSPPSSLQTPTTTTTTASATTPVITRVELVHMMHCLFDYVHKHLDHLETIPPSPTPLASRDEAAESGTTSTASLSAVSSLGSGSVSFHDAQRFGLTLAVLPPFPGCTARATTTTTTTTMTQHSSAGADANACHLRAALHELLLLIGYVCLDHAALQEVFAWGGDTPLLHSLLRALPSHYFASARHIFFPTLLAIIADNDRNALIARQEMSLQQLLLFVQDEYKTLSKRAKSYAQAHHAALLASKLQNDPHRALRLSVKGKNWAQLTDDDDTLSSATTTTTTTTTHDGVTTTSALEKEKLCRTLRAGSVLWQDCFRIERRVPVTYWPGIIQQLHELLSAAPV